MLNTILAGKVGRYGAAFVSCRKRISAFLSDRIRTDVELRELCIWLEDMNVLEKMLRVVIGSAFHADRSLVYWSHNFQSICLSMGQFWKRRLVEMVKELFLKLDYRFDRDREKYSSLAPVFIPLFIEEETVCKVTPFVILNTTLILCIRFDDPCSIDLFLTKVSASHMEEIFKAIFNQIILYDSVRCFQYLVGKSDFSQFETLAKEIRRTPKICEYSYRNILMRRPSLDEIMRFSDKCFFYLLEFFSENGAQRQYSDEIFLRCSKLGDVAFVLASIHQTDFEKMVVNVLLKYYTLTEDIAIRISKKTNGKIILEKAFQLHVFPEMTSPMLFFTLAQVGGPAIIIEHVLTSKTLPSPCYGAHLQFHFSTKSFDKYEMNDLKTFALLLRHNFHFLVEPWMSAVQSKYGVLIFALGRQKVRVTQREKALLVSCLDKESDNYDDLYEIIWSMDVIAST